MGREGTLQASLNNLNKIFKSDRCSIRRPTRNGQLELLAAKGDYQGSRQKMILVKGTAAGDAMINRQIIIVPDISKDPRYDQNFVDPNGPKWMAAFPIKFQQDDESEEEILGVIQIYRKKRLSKGQIDFADTMVQSVGPTLHLIRVSKTNRQAIVDLVIAISSSFFECQKFRDMSKRAVEIISDHLEVPSCLIYQVFKRNGKLWQKIIAGVPPGAHKIDDEELLSKRAHLESAVNKGELEVIDNPLHDPRTQNIADIIKAKDIKALLLNPIKKGGNGENENIIGILVLDACKEKEGFSAEERSFAYDAGKILSGFIDRDDAALKEFQHQVRNPNWVMQNIVERFIEPLTEIYNLAESICKNGTENCATGQRIYELAAKLVPRAEMIKLEAKRIDRSVSKISDDEI